MAPAFDPYTALGVARGATDKDIKSAHRRLAKRFHPDATQGDTVRFLLVQEAYRVLSNPLLRREWDERHAPGPFRADQAATARARAPRPPARPAAPRQPARPARSGPTRNFDDASTPPSGQPPGTADRQPGPGRPRSSRAYTWSASEVPWWEEGTSPNRRQPGRKRPSRERPGAQPAAGSAGAAGPASTGTGPDTAPEQPSGFDVYNRSSGAAWSMAARAYFRRGDQELPNRGTFQYQGTQVLTGARARTAAEAEARARARATAAHTAQTAQATHTAHTAGHAAAAPAHSAAPAYAYTSAGVARDARSIHRVREQFRRRTNAQAWPSLRERLFYALLAWIPIATLIGYGGSVALGCDRASASVNCPANLETGQAVAIALVLGLLVALPRVAYVGALASIGALLVGLLAVGLMAFSGVRPPLSMEETALVAAALTAAYLATALIVLVRDRGSRPWHAGSAGYRSADRSG